MSDTVIRTAEPWTPWSVTAGILLLVALVAVTVWGIRRSGGR